MIMIKIDGRLGNQMFQYAFAKSKAIEKNTWVMPIINSFPLQLHKYFNIPISDYITTYLFFNRFLKKISRRIIETTKNHFDFYEGYFQSLQYFEQNKHIITSIYTIKKRYRRKYHEESKKLANKKKQLVIHFRGGDYYQLENDLLGGKDPSLPAEYYLSCLKQIQDLETYDIFVIGDDLNKIKKYLIGYQYIRFVQYEPIIDFQFMLEADILIISNSSFAWWGAFLNKKNPIVFAPRYWLGFKVKNEYPQGISYGLNWKWVEWN